MLLSDYKLSTNLEIVFPQADRVLSWAKICIEAILIKKNESLTERLNKIDLSVEACGTPEITSL